VIKKIFGRNTFEQIIVYDNSVNLEGYSGSLLACPLLM
jgi:hypothetical protein